MRDRFDDRLLGMGGNGGTWSIARLVRRIRKVGFKGCGDGSWQGLRRSVNTAERDGLSRDRDISRTSATRSFKLVAAFEDEQTTSNST